MLNDEEYYSLDENDKKEMKTKIQDTENKQVQSYTKKVEECISMNSFKEAKKYGAYINKIDTTKADEIIKRIEMVEEVYETRIQRITINDVNNMYQTIISRCKSDEEIQKLYQVLEYYHNNP